MTKSPVGSVGNFYNEDLLKMSVSTSSVQGANKDCVIISEAGVIIADGTNPPYRQPFILTGASIQSSYINSFQSLISSITGSASQAITPSLNGYTLLLYVPKIGTGPPPGNVPIYAPSISALTLTLPNGSGSFITSNPPIIGNFAITIVNQNISQNPGQTGSCVITYPASSGTTTYTLPLNQSITFGIAQNSTGVYYLLPQ
jgi:hypothetical protein